MTKKNNCDSIDITEEFVNLPVQEIIKLLTFLEKNGYKKTYFDGYDAALYLLRIPTEIFEKKETDE